MMLLRLQFASRESVQGKSGLKLFFHLRY